MKGIKLLLSFLLCLVTSGAWAQNAEKVFTGNVLTWESGDYVQVKGVVYHFRNSIKDEDSGLVYFMADQYEGPETNGVDTTGYCVVGLMTDYKTAKDTTINNTTYSSAPKDSVYIPASIGFKYTSGGTTYTRVKKVKYIGDYMFTTYLNGTVPNYYYTYPDGSTKYILSYNGHNDGEYPRNYFYNRHLRKVTFSPNSELITIGMGAFQGCTSLESIVIPSSVTTIGTEAFTYCMNLTDVKFQTYTDGTTKKTHLTSLPRNCFYQCNSLQALDIPEGVTSIANYAIQDCWKLKQINLPNTLTTIGVHFLCRALSLKSFYIPASVTSIAGAFLHGCENLRNVYLLGDASVLGYASGSSHSFGNEVTTASPAVNGVNNCTFHILAEYKDNYLSTSNYWYLISGGSNGAWGRDGSADTDQSYPITIAQAEEDTEDSEGNTISGQTDYTHNRITWAASQTVPDQYVKEFDGYKWQSVIFYDDISMTDFKKTFGDGALVAEFTGCTKDSPDAKLYHFQFTTRTDKVPGKTPLMIYIAKDAAKYIFNTDWQKGLGETDAWIKFYTTRYNVDQTVYLTGTTTATNDVATMVGLAVPIPMHQNEFYFKWVKKSDTDYTQNYGEIRRANYAGQADKTRYSCFWQIARNGIEIDGAKANSAKSFVATDFNAPTGIDKVKTEKRPSFDINIYDINGRLVGTSRNDLPRGMYIQGGKKFIKK